jgi:hypothetical protein
MDCVLVQSGKAHEIFPGLTKAALCFKVHEGEQEPRAIYPQATIDAIVEVDSGTVAVGDTWNGLTFVQLTQPAEPTLAAIKAALKARVDAAAEQQRLRYVTAGAGQAMVYLAKEAELIKWIAASRPQSPDRDDYPWAKDRAAATGASVAQVLGEWEQRVALWQTVGRAIEIAREGAKAAIDAAANEADAAAVLESISWPS